MMVPPLNPTLVVDQRGLDDVAAWLQSLPEGHAFGLDFETNVTKTFANRVIRTIQLGDKNVQFVIDLLAFAGSTKALVASQGNYGAAAELLLGPVVRVLKAACESRSLIKVGQGLQFEYEMMRWNLGIRLTGLYCCLLAEKTLRAGLVHFMAKGYWDLVALVHRYTGLTMEDNDLGRSFDLATPLTEKQLEYCGLDVRLPLAVRLGQTRLLEAEGLQRTAQIEFDAISPFGDMHLNGVLLAEAPWRELMLDAAAKKGKVVAAMDRLLIPVVGRKGSSPEDAARLDALENKWRDCGSKTSDQKLVRAAFRKEFMALRKDLSTREAGTEKCEGEAFINYGAPAQLRDALYKMGYSKRDLPDTSDKTLAKLAKFPQMTLDVAFATCKELTSPASGVLLKLPLIDLVRLHRSLNKSLTTYGETWVLTSDQRDAEGNKGVVDPVTGRIHSNISQYGAATGRTSSSSPNIQNIPQGSAYRYCFVSRPGFKLLTIDFNGCELRIMAELSGEKEWIDAFLKGWDVHSVGAELLYGKQWKDGAEAGCRYYSDHDKCKCKVHKELRGYVKAVNFGIAYGKGAGALAEELGISKDAGQALLDLYRKTFPTITEYLKGLGSNAKTMLCARTLAGRKRGWLQPNWDRAKALVEADLNKKKGKPGSKTPVKYATSAQVSNKLKGMWASIEREGKNTPIQGSNADIIKRAMYLIWLKLEEEYGAFFYNMVHDELVIECPDETAEACFKFVGDTMTEAGAEFVKLIPMTTEGKISTKWEK